MKTKSLVVILILAVMILAAGSAYSGRGPKGRLFGSTVEGHPWEDLKNTTDTGSGVPASTNVTPDYQRVIAIPIFSDFMILIYIQDINEKNSDSGSSIRFRDKSYQIIFSR